LHPTGRPYFRRVPASVVPAFRRRRRKQSGRHPSFSARSAAAPNAPAASPSPCLGATAALAGRTGLPDASPLRAVRRAAVAARVSHRTPPTAVQVRSHPARAGNRFPSRETRHPRRGADLLEGQPSEVGVSPPRAPDARP
jgi:hypothetical protein